MKNLLNQKQRSQALAWYSTMGFSLENIAEHYGITPDQVSRELNTARQHRKQAGKSPEPVPVRAPGGKPRTTQAVAYLEALNALETIIWQVDKLTPEAALVYIKATAAAVIKKAGIT